MLVAGTRRQNDPPHYQRFHRTHRTLVSENGRTVSGSNLFFFPWRTKLSSPRQPAIAIVGYNEKEHILPLFLLLLFVLDGWAVETVKQCRMVAKMFAIVKIYTVWRL